MMPGKRGARSAKNWKLGRFMPLTLWTTEENQIFFRSLASSLTITKGVGLKLGHGVLDMGALEMIMKALESSGSGYDWMLMEELDTEYPQGSWWEMVWHLANMHKSLARHSMFEINYKLLRAIENILLPLNAMFAAQPMNPQYCLRDGTYHPLTSAVVRYCNYCYVGSLAMPRVAESSFFDFFMQAMLEQHGTRMATFLHICRDNMLCPSPPPSATSEDEELAMAMDHLSLKA